MTKKKKVVKLAPKKGKGTKSPTKVAKPKVKFHALKLYRFPGLELKVAKSALANLKGVATFLTPKTWIKGEYLNAEDEEGFVQACLIGAVERVDGIGELLATTILAQVLTGEPYMDESVLGYLDENKLVEAGFTVFDGTHNNEVVEPWNDEGERTFAQVQHLLAFAIAQAELLVAEVKAKRLPPYKIDWAA